MKKSVSMLFLIVSATACGSNGGPAAPAASSPVATAQGAATAAGRVVPGIFGFVSDTAFRALNGATITVVDGPQAGTSTTADATGQFTLTGSFDRRTTFRAAKEGYVTAAQTWSCSGGADCQATAAPWLGFYLAPLSSPLDVAGRYTLTFTADSACMDLPDEVRTRTYTAAIAASASPNVPAGTSFTATVGGAAFVSGLDNFTVGVSGTYVDLWLHGGHDPALVEQLGPNTYLLISGNAAGAAGSAPLSSMSAAFDGWIEYCVTTTTPRAGHACEGTVLRRCESSHHRLVLTRQ